MDNTRNVEKSVEDYLTRLFTNPTDTLSGPWQVYGEDKATDPSFQPKPPFIFLLDADARPQAARLPLMKLRRMPYSGVAFELGNAKGTLWAFALTLVGRNRGERSSLAAYVFEKLVSFPVYNYTPAVPVFVEQVPILRRVAGIDPARQELALEATFSRQETVVFDFQTQL